MVNSETRLDHAPPSWHDEKASAVAEAFSRLPFAGAGLLGCRSHFAVRLGILPAEALDAARRVNHALLARVERVARGANFHVNVALMGRTGLKIVSAGAHHPHRGIIGMNLFLGHRSRQTFPAIHLL